MMSAAYRWVVGTVIVIATAGYGPWRYREYRMERLYEAACGSPPAFRSTREAQAAIRKLATFRGERSTQLLMSVALGHGFFPWTDVQCEAIKALALRHDDKISVSLASLLQPHLPQPVRRSVAEALLNLPCSDDCVRLVLHYLERLSKGELNLEDRYVMPPGLSESTKARLARDREGLPRTLCQVLRREPGPTLRVLHDVYGLGTDAPSVFGLEFLARAQMREACPAVLESEGLVEGAEAIFHAPREELRATIGALKCQ